MELKLFYAYSRYPNIQSYWRKDTIVFNGPDEQFIGGFMIGAEGGIGGTYGAMPKLFLKALECFKKETMKQLVQFNMM